MSLLFLQKNTNEVKTVKTYIMQKEKLPQFLTILQGDGNLYGPVKQKNHHSFELIKDLSMLDLKYTHVLLGMKKFLTTKICHTTFYKT